MISQEDIDRILEASKIEEVVGEFVDLKRKGVNYTACCPFHSEKTPSFYVNPAKGIFKCFGCGEGGDSVAFLRKYQHYTYPEALRWLAKKYNIEIKEKELSAEELQARDEKDILFHINELACKYYYDNLFHSEEGQSLGLTYFNERQISRKTIDTWQLGYAKQKGDDFALYALNAGYKEEELIKSGLCLRSEKDGSLYDRFRGRVTFPVYNIGGRVLGFSARILANKDKTKAKYVNSPESPIYIKGKTLFGLNFARNEIAKQDLCYLVEGNVDAVMMHQNEVTNVVASSGTALTEDQIRMIKRYTDNVAVLYDGDAAGIHAAIRATDMFLKEGMHVSVVLFPQGDDPDSFARKHTQDEFHTFLKENARNFIVYRCNLALEQANKDPIKKATLVKEIIHSISLIPDLIERTAYIQQCSSILSMREDILTDQLNKEMIHNAFLADKENKRKQQKTGNASHSDNTVVGENQTAFDGNQTTIRTNETTVDDNQIADNENKAIDNEPEISAKEEILERNIIRILLQYSNLPTNQPVLVNDKMEMQQFIAGAFILQDMASSEIKIKHPVYKKIYDAYHKEYFETGKVMSVSDIMRDGDPMVTNVVSTLLMESARITISENWVKYGMIVPDINSQQVIDDDIKYTTLSIKLHKLSVLMEEQKRQMQENPTDMTLMTNFSVLTKMRNIIAKELNRTTF